MSKGKLSKEIIKIKSKLEEAGLGNLLSNLVYMPAVPISGISKEFIIGEIMGVKIAFPVSAPKD